MAGETFVQKIKRAERVLAILRQTYPNAKIALKYGNNIQLLVAVILSAQCTDKKVNEVTETLFSAKGGSPPKADAPLEHASGGKKYKTAVDFAHANLKTFEQEIRSTGFYRAKARNIIAACTMIEKDFGDKLPRTMEDMLKLPGVARKTANVVIGNAYGVIEGIAVDTHVRRLAQRLGFSAHDNPVKIEKDLMELFPKKDWFKLTYTLIDHGRAICKAPIPRCEICPVNKLCPTGIKRLGLKS